MNQAPRAAGLGPAGFHPWRGPKLTLRDKDAAPFCFWQWRAATYLWSFPEAGGGQTLPCSPAGAARNRLGFKSV